MSLEILDLDFSYVPAVAVRRHEFKLTRFTDEILHGLGDFVVKDMLPWHHPRPLKTLEEFEVRPLHFAILSTCHWLDQDCIAVYLYHEHDVLVFALRLDGKTACLIRIDGTLGFHYLDVDITFLLSL